MSARFEIVRTNAGHHARFIAANGRTVWTTEVYTRRRAAVAAVELIAGAQVTTSRFADHPEISWAGNEGRGTTEVRDVDEWVTR